MSIPFRAIIPILLLLCLLAVPVSADILNLSMISGYPYQKIVWNSGSSTHWVSDMRYDLAGGYGGFGGIGGGGAGGRSGDTTTPAIYPGSYVVAEQVLNYNQEGAPLYFVLSRNNGDYLSGYITLEPTSSFWGQRIVHINEGGGADWIGSYTRDPTGHLIYAQNLHLFAAIDPCTNKQYFVIREANPSVETVTEWTQIFNTDLGAVIEIDSITANPIYKVEWTSLNMQSFNVEIAAVKHPNYVESATRATCRPDGTTDPLAFLSWLLDPIRNMFSEFQKVINRFAAFIGLMQIISGLIFAGQIFAGINILYLVFTTYLAVDKASIDNPFSIIHEVFKNLRKLFRFYMELFESIKKVVIIWSN